jgi:hypothetical protein
MHLSLAIPGGTTPEYSILHPLSLPMGYALHNQPLLKLLGAVLL